MTNRTEPMKNVLLREQDRPRRRHNLSSRIHAGHQDRMAAHMQRVAAEMPGFTEPPDLEATYIDEGVDIPEEAFDVLRFRAFQTAYRRGNDVLDPRERFARAVLDSARPMKDPAALRQWYEEIYVPRLEARMAKRTARAAAEAEAEHADTAEVTHAYV